MRNFLFLFALVAWIAFPACQSGETTEEPEEETFDPAIIQGTWEMTGVLPADTNEIIAPDYHQYKIYTEDHVFFLAFNADSVLMIGGGTYTINQDSFTEDLSYMTFYDESLPTSYSFIHQIDSTTFAQSGVMESEEGEEDFKLEERYRRVEGSVADGLEGHPLVGVWKLDQALYGDDEELAPLPDSMQMLKVITPGHFMAVNYNKNNPGDVNVVFGAQRMEGGKMIESVLVNSWSATMNNVEVPLEIEGGDATYSQKGTMAYEG